MIWETNKTNKQANKISVSQFFPFREVPIFERGNNCFPLRAVPNGMENHFYHIR